MNSSSNSRTEISKLSKPDSIDCNQWAIGTGSKKSQSVALSEIDFQNHFVIKKRINNAEYVKSNVESFAHEDPHLITNNKLKAPRKAQSMLPTLLSKNSEQKPLESKTRNFTLISPVFEDNKDAHPSKTKSHIEMRSRWDTASSFQEFAGMSKVKSLIDKFNKASLDKNSNVHISTASMSHKTDQADTIFKNRNTSTTPIDVSSVDTSCCELFISKQKKSHLQMDLMEVRKSPNAAVTTCSASVEGSLFLVSASCSVHKRPSSTSLMPNAPQLVQNAASDESKQKKPLYPFHQKSNKTLRTSLVASTVDHFPKTKVGRRSKLTSENNALAPIQPLQTFADKVIRCSTRLDVSPMDEDNPFIKPYLISPKLLFGYDACTPEKRVLKICHQINPIPMALVFQGLDKIQKVGEGVFGEVFLGSYSDQAAMRVYKVVPIQGTERVNGEKQKTYSEIYPEIFISKKLSKLNEGYQGCWTDGYIKLHNARIAVGSYPEILVNTWKIWDKRHKSDNDCPEFSPEQLYIIFEFDYGGRDAEAFVFQNAKQAFHLALQVAHILAVGEAAAEFEHRDLHWGNILVQRTESNEVKYILNGLEFKVPSSGVKGCIIDFTIARILNDDLSPIFLDLKDDEEQFLGTGDHQFDIYRMMRDRNRNEWGQFCPKTNTYWVHYFADKLMGKGRFEEIESVEHNFFMKQLRNLKDIVMRYESCTEFIGNKVCEEFKNLQTPSPSKNEILLAKSSHKILASQGKRNKFNVA